MKERKGGEGERGGRVEKRDGWRERDGAIEALHGSIALSEYFAVINYRNE